MIEYQFLAEKLITYDIYLAVLRNDLVPEKMEDIEFWHRIYYEIERIKRDLGIESILKSKKTSVSSNAETNCKKVFDSGGLQKKDSTDIYANDEAIDDILEKSDKPMKEFKHRNVGRENEEGDGKMSNENIEDDIEIVIED